MGRSERPYRLARYEYPRFFCLGLCQRFSQTSANATENEVRETIIAAFETITPEIAHRATHSTVQRAELCVREEDDILNFCIKFLY